MRFFMRKLHPDVIDNLKKAEELKTAIIQPDIEAKRQVKRLNKLMSESNEFALKISVFYKLRPEDE